ncbi:MAG: TMEM43 family protein [Thermostichales cyanobacterium HHBFW_bins_127]
MLFLGSFWVLFWNEGRVNLSHVAARATAIPATGAPTVAVGSLVSVSGPITSTELVGDNAFLRPGAYIAVNRQVEMYAWEEQKKTRTREEFGGSETRETTYSYRKVWTDQPQDSSRFYARQQHYNPPMPLRSQLFRVNQAQVGNYVLNLANLNLETPTLIPLSSATIANGLITDSYIFQGRGSLQAPEIGDIRVQYAALNNGTEVTVFGRLASANSLDSFLGPRNVKLYRLFAADRETAIQRMSVEHDVLTWVLRLIGFLMMWIGSSMVFEPLNTMFSIFPFLSGLSRFLTKGITLIVSLVLSSITIVVGMVARNPVVLGICLAVAGFFILRLLGKRRASPGSVGYVSYDG